MSGDTEAPVTNRKTRRQRRGLSVVEQRRLTLALHCAGKITVRSDDPREAIRDLRAVTAAAERAPRVRVRKAARAARKQNRRHD